MNNAELILNAAGKLNPKTLWVVVSQGGTVKTDSRIPFSLVRTMLKLGRSFSPLISQFGGGMSKEDLLAIIETVDVDEILTALASDGARLPYALVDMIDQSGQHIRVTLE